jgi:pyrimidine operon attenuation protein/uracil phosphoribosyltransferase
MKDNILDSSKVKQTMKRLAYEIYENSYQETEVHLIGINTAGMLLGEKLKNQLIDISPLEVQIHQLSINPKRPLDETSLSVSSELLKGKQVIIVDDVANTGRTLFYGCRPIMDVLPKKIEFAVLVDRKHKHFPVKVDYVGLSLATTLKENIVVEFNGNDTEVYFA